MKKTSSRKQDFHSDWLSQVDIEGPFLALPVLKDIWKDGVDRLGDADDRLLTYKQAFTRWQRALDKFAAEPRTPESKAAYAEVNHAWIYTVLDQLAEWDELRTDVDVSVQSPGEQVTVTATAGLEGRDGQAAALLLICEPTPGGLRETGLDGWPATEVDRLAMLLRKANVEVGIVTDGQWWALVSARDEKPTGSGMFNALTWAEEPLLRDAFFTLINQRRFRTLDTEQRLTKLFERSELEAEAITEALGTQVRRSVELLVQAFSEARLKAAKGGDPDPLTEKPDDVYQAAVTVMMRIVFLLFAEERDMLPTEQLYWESYAIKDLLAGLQAQAAGGEEQLDETYDAWHRLLAVSKALHGGVNYDEMRMPAYGGSLLDPDRFPWLHAMDGQGLRLKVSDRVMMHALESVQTVVTGGERRRISFQEIDVEQIGYIYEGLLGYSCSNVTDDIVLGLVGKDGEEPEIPLGTLNELSDQHRGDPRKVAAALVAWTKENQPAATSKTAAALTKLIAKEPAAEERAELIRLLTPVAGGDTDLLETLIGWGNLIRRDLRNLPLVYPIGGLVVVETPSRKNAGAHYTPRSLAEEVVLHALQPLVYEPGPLQTNDDSEWKLKSAAEILDLKVADIAAGSGAFLVAAARYLAKRVVEAWTREEMLSDADIAAPHTVEGRALREVIARCLYGADINPMAVEMCKLSLWLVSMDKTKPFSFVDDKVFCGNSLLGLTDLDQLRYLHFHPDPIKMHLSLLADIDEKIATATRLRNELANPVEEHNPMRSARTKRLLLEQVHRATDDLKLIADSVVATGLHLGGKPGRELDDALTTLSWQVHEAFPADGSQGNRENLLHRINLGLTPEVETDYEQWKPLHWAIEAPDVITERNGFDAIIGNPPFLAGKKISTAYGTNMEAWLKVDQEGKRGAADICAHFIRRAWSLIRSDTGGVGLIGSDRVGQGDTAAMSSEVIANSGVIYRAISEFRWPGKASTGAAIVWATKNSAKMTASANLNGSSVESISGSLADSSQADTSTAQKLTLEFNAGNGIYLYGEGFVLDQNDPLISTLSGTEKRFLRPFINGQSLLSGQPSGRLAIDVNCFTNEDELVHAAPTLAAHLFRTVKPIRDAVTSQVHDTRYWAHWDKREALFSAVGKLNRFLVLARDTRVPAFLITDDNRSLYSDKVVILATDQFAHYGILNSGIHYAWFERTKTGRGATSSYIVSRCLRTFAFPSEPRTEIDKAARSYEAARSRALMSCTSITELYNDIDDSLNMCEEVRNVRDAQVALDVVVLRAYGWEDINLDYGHQLSNTGTRWSPSGESRAEIVRRLAALNQARIDVRGRAATRIDIEHETPVS
ncbi:Eco57I restriction-modification methylase domain-containing protein [Gordonia hongkongensis]|uniref:Eco57I restriction-modification methylase domain-containing protein n=1 Tax=Gordonia hongkongensis TaxID=1701090 RepID=UPI003EBE6D21